jgi:hypothetical protein
MAVLLHHPPAGGAHAVAVLKRDIAATLSQQQLARPVLLCHWLQDADGRLSCHWEIAPAARIPIHPGW